MAKDPNDQWPLEEGRRPCCTPNTTLDQSKEHPQSFCTIILVTWVTASAHDGFAPVL